MKVGVFGAGYSGQKIGKKLAEAGASVWGTSRDEENFDSLAKHNVTPLDFDGLKISDAVIAELHDTTHLIVSIAPPRKSGETPIVDPVLNTLAEHSLATLAPKLKWIGYLSTVGVYGDHDGAWVDEDTPATPASERSRQRVKAENEWLKIGGDNKIPVGIFRLAGIYGPGRNALINAHKGTSRRMVKKDQVFNRIHVGDIARALTLAAQQKASGIFNITDDEPAPPQDVVSFAHGLIGTEPPEEIDFETADISEMARSFYGENKRASNKLSKQALGLNYAFPNYREALSHMWKNDGWRG